MIFKNKLQKIDNSLKSIGCGLTQRKINYMFVFTKLSAIEKRERR